MSGSTLPTTDLYVLNSCGSWVRRWWRDGPLERLSANCLRAADTLLLIRRDESKVMEKALAWPGTLIYLIDDDIDGAAQSPSLPAAYRARLAHFAERHYDRLLRRADIIVASSAVLAETLRSDPRVHADIVQIDPFWALPFADQSHFLQSPEGLAHIVHLGTASHSGGLAKTTPAVIATLDRFAAARFTFVAPSGSHPELEAHRQARRLDVMSWRRYRRWLPRQRFHLALYPLEQTPFDRARSANKIFEHAIVGAVGVYPCDWDPATMVGDGAIAAPIDPANWADNLLDVMAQRSDLAARARRAATRLVERQDRLEQQSMWAHLLRIDANGRYPA